MRNAIPSDCMRSMTCLFKAFKASSSLAIADGLHRRIDCDNMIVTHGSFGCYPFSAKTGVTRVPAFTKTVVDTVGAGDAFLTITAPLVAAGGAIEDVAFIGNAAGAIKVGPASDFGKHFAGPEFEVELISLRGECKEATVWFGELVSCRRRATRLHPRRRRPAEPRRRSCLGSAPGPRR